MRKIILTSYPVIIKQKDGNEITLPYNVKESLSSILFQTVLKLQAPQLLKQETLSEKIKNSNDSVLVEEEEYGRILTAINAIEGLGRNELEFVHRIHDAQKVEVEPKE